MPTIYGSPNNNVFELIHGTSQSDLIFPLGGWDYVDGKGGTDTVVVAGLSSQFRLVQDSSVTYIDAVSSASAYADRVQLVNIERVQFSDKVVSLEIPRLFKAQAGDDEYQGGAGIDWLNFEQVRNHYEFETIGAALRVTDKTGQTGSDILRSIERVRFSDGVWLTPENTWISQQIHASYAEAPTELYQFFAVAFGAIPGVTYMNQLTEAYSHGMSIKEIVNIFTTKSQFTDIYAPNLSHSELALLMVNNIVKNSASAEAKRMATQDITKALDYGMTVGDVLFNVFGNLSQFHPTDTQWGGTSRLMNNQVNVARYLTDTLSFDTIHVPVLQSLLRNISEESDTSTPQSTAQLVGIALSAQGLVENFADHTAWLTVAN